MNCEQVRAKLSALWDHELPEAPAQRMREHLAECAACGMAWAALSDLHQALQRYPNTPAPTDLAARISMAARRRLEERELAPWRRMFHALRPAFLLRAAALATLVALGFLMGASSPSPVVAGGQPADRLEVFDVLPPQTPGTAITDVMQGPEARS